MSISDFNLPEGLGEFLKRKNYQSFYPPQEDALKAGVLDGARLLVTTPTSSGKTLIALMAAYATVKKGKKVVYTAPLRALASEKYKEFKELGFRCAISTGDYDLSGETLGRADIIVLTNERFDSVMRHRVSWIDRVGLFISDEIHLIADPGRGATLEMILTKMKAMEGRQLLALSATVSNAEEIAAWLGAKLVKSGWRPVPLKNGVYKQPRIIYDDGSAEQVPMPQHGGAIATAMDTVRKGGQSLIFCGTRKKAVSMAARASILTGQQLTDEERQRCLKASEEIKGGEEGTELSDKLAELLKRGSAFHHAGLLAEHRELVETLYRERLIKVLASTTSLAYGINVPARRVVVSDISRYSAEERGMSDIPVFEYRQMAGRAGRPQYDSFGEAIIISPESRNPRELLEEYAKGDTEQLLSQLRNENAIRFHSLAIIAGEETDLVSLGEEFGETLLARQAGKRTVNRLVTQAVEYLLENGLVENKRGFLSATEFGKRTAMLYIDPATAVLFREGLEASRARKSYESGILHLITRSADFGFVFELRGEDYDRAESFLRIHGEELMLPSKYVINEMRPVMALSNWINEVPEQNISKDLKIEPGDMHRMVETAQWLLYSMGELSKLFGKQWLLDEIRALEKRAQKGIKEELLDLIRLRGIGRVRARSLFSNGIRTVNDVKLAQEDLLARMDKIGPALAKRTKEQASKFGPKLVDGVLEVSETEDPLS